MDKKHFLEAIKVVRTSPKKKFAQTFEFIINLRGLNLKKPEEQIELWIPLPAGKPKQNKICALVGPELATQAKTACDHVIIQDNFSTFTTKKDIKKLANQYDYFIAQANIMPEVAKTFGRWFGPRGKMPNPKIGCVVPPNANLTQLVERLRHLVKLSAKTQASIKVAVGKEDMKDEDIANNMQAVYNNIVSKLPQETFNIKNVQLKLTMSAPVRITDKSVETREAAP